MATPDMKQFEVKLGRLGWCNCEPCNPAPVPENGRLVAANILPHFVVLPKRYSDFPRSIYAFRVSVVETAGGERYAQAEYMVVEHCSLGKITASFEPLGSNIEDAPFGAVNKAAQEMFCRHKGKSLFDMVAA